MEPCVNEVENTSNDINENSSGNVLNSMNNLRLNDSKNCEVSPRSTHHYKKEILRRNQFVFNEGPSNYISKSPNVTDMFVNKNANIKRLDYLSWSDTFMGLAKLVAMRSKDPNTQVGACVVNSENRIVSVGYNGMPNGCDDNEFPWGKGDDLDSDKHLYVCHAETNAIHNRNTSSLKNCILYVTLFPCNECAKHVIQSGITCVVYLYDKNPEKKSVLAAKRMFDKAGVVYKKFEPSEIGKSTKIVIDLS